MLFSNCVAVAAPAAPVEHLEHELPLLVPFRGRGRFCTIPIQVFFLRVGVDSNKRERGFRQRKKLSLFADGADVGGNAPVCE